jgi:hypothetical protein
MKNNITDAQIFSPVAYDSWRFILSCVICDDSGHKISVQFLFGPIEHKTEARVGQNRKSTWRYVAPFKDMKAS